MAEEIWRLPREIATTGMGRNWIYAEIAQGWIPVPLNLGRRAVGWRGSDVAGWPASCKGRKV
ncbi:helix-turn-helix transcriptional regulator [Paracoccus pantotrophus]|uniref:helix-turn-helix transcriptional regulator n=1 Tax=Paracoccus pantotrophus TaxID=82367 RepID=UPI0008E2FAD1|nr:AlpA family phage regulatory protein [Paracoccus pantotrophus]MDF3856145.1 AlpA family phage regulatory protein [Paracoccus pantotrophus]SFP01023.1 transcriptional regulator, AlpA family [Paracoccus pantotrophus]